MNKGVRHFGIPSSGLLIPGIGSQGLQDEGDVGERWDGPIPSWAFVQITEAMNKLIKHHLVK
jgi:hypothetical protein